MTLPLSTHTSPLQRRERNRPVQEGHIILASEIDRHNTDAKSIQTDVILSPVQSLLESAEQYMDNQNFTAALSCASEAIEQTGGDRQAVKDFLDLKFAYFSTFDGPAGAPHPLALSLIRQKDHLPA